MCGKSLNIRRRVVDPERAVDKRKRCRRWQGWQRGELRHVADGHHDLEWGLVSLKGDQSDGGLDNEEEDLDVEEEDGVDMLDKVLERYRSYWRMMATKTMARKHRTNRVVRLLRGPLLILLDITVYSFI